MNFKVFLLLLYIFKNIKKDGTQDLVIQENDEEKRFEEDFIDNMDSNREIRKMKSIKRLPKQLNLEDFMKLAYATQKWNYSFANQNDVLDFFESNILKIGCLFQIRFFLI